MAFQRLSPLGFKYARRLASHPHRTKTGVSGHVAPDCGVKSGATVEVVRGESYSLTLHCSHRTPWDSGKHGR